MMFTKKTVSILLSVFLIFTMTICAGADGTSSTGVVGTRAVVGADLTDDQIALVYNNFGITRGTVPEFRMNNTMERQYLEGYVDSSVIGTRSVSCVYVTIKNDGSGMNVSTSNVNWCTANMYISALATAGITDADIIVTAPFEVSGTAALVGIYWAYEDITGNTLSETAKLVSTQELTVTGNLAEEIGSMDATDIVNDLKLMLDETQTMTDDEIREEIVAIAAEYNVSLTEKQISQLISLCRSLEEVKGDDNALIERVQQVQSTLTKVKEAKTKVTGFIDTVQKTVESVSSFFTRIAGILGFNNSPAQ